MKAPVDVAVVGVGYLGSRHAEKYAAHPSARLRALVDPAPGARDVARRLGVPLLAHVAELPEGVRAVSVAVPTPLHREVAGHLLEKGRDVLLEKPIAASVAEADELVALAEANGRVLQVGHLERFNPAVRKLGGLLRGARFIESHRLAPFHARGSDVDVVLDLMIHDLDIILSIVRADPVEVHAAGVAVITPSVDIANARIAFEGGCVANVTASRVSAEKLRKIRVFQPDAYVSIDYLGRSATVVRRGGEPGAQARTGGASAPPERPPNEGDALAGIVRERVTFADEEGEDALALEVDAFLRAVRDRSEPVVSGRDGRRAVAVAGRIVEQIEAGLERERRAFGSGSRGADAGLAS
ncbi:MAG: Gfo/Idh/MocA family oxidoreductase [Gemmatimonadota bacterium]